MKKERVSEQYLIKPISIRKIPVQARSLLLAIGELGFIAGGYARWIVTNKKSDLPSDIDIFLHEEEGLDLEIEVDEEERPKLVPYGKLVNALWQLGYVYSKSSANALEFTHKNKKYLKTQVIIPFSNEHMRTYGRPIEVLNQFDFPVAKVAIELMGNKFFKITHKNFLNNFNRRRLYIDHINCPVAVSLRVAKYCNKGYHIRPREIMKLFVEWDQRPDEYKRRLVELSFSDNLDGSDWNELERLLRID